MKKLFLFFLSIFLTSAAFAQTAVLVANDGTTGTTVNETAIVNSTLNAIAAGTGNTAVPTYIVVGGAGTTGQAQLATSGPASCVMDTTIGSAAGWYYVINSTTAAKECHPQSAAPSAGTWVIGYLSASSTTSGAAAQVVVSSFVYGGSSSGALPTVGAHQWIGNPSGGSATAAANAIGAQDTSPGGFAAAAGSVNVLTATLTPAVTSYVTGLEVSILPNLANTSTTPTLNLNSLGAVTITKKGTSPLAAGDLSTTAIAWLVYDGTEFQLLNPQTSNTTGTTTGETAWQAGTGSLPALPSNAAGFMGPQTGGTSFLYQLPATAVAGFMRAATPGTVNGVNASGLSAALINVNDLTTLYVAGGGTAQAQTATLTPAATSLVAGLHVYWVPTAANTAAAPTLAVSGLTATTITKCGTTALIANDLTTTAVAHAIFDGTRFQLLNPQAAGCGSSGSLPASLTSAGSGANSNFGIGQSAPITQLEVGGPTYQDAPTTGSVAFSASCSATATSCAITGGTSLNANGGVVLASFTSGGNNQEFICYSAATSTTLTIGGGNCATPVTTSGRSYWGSTAAVHNNGEQLAMVEYAVVANPSSQPVFFTLGGANAASQSMGFSAGAGVFTFQAGLIFGSKLYLPNNPAYCLVENPAQSGGLCAALENGSWIWINTSASATLITAGTTLDYSIATQAITGTGTLTAVTNAQTPQFQNNTVAASAGTGGVLSSHCTIIWNQATSGTVSFGVKASATPGHIWVKEQDSPGSYTNPIFTTITSTTTTATTGTITPTAFGTTYASDLWIAMDPGTSNSPSVQLYASASANTITIEPGTGCGAWQ